MYNYKRGAQRQGTGRYSGKFEGVNTQSLEALCLAAVGNSSTGISTHLSHTDRLLLKTEWVKFVGIRQLTDAEFQECAAALELEIIQQHWGGEVLKRTNQAGAERLLRLYRAAADSSYRAFLEAWAFYKEGGDATEPVTLSADETAMVNAMAAISPEMASALEARLLAGKASAAAEAKPAAKLSGASLLKQRLESLK